MSIVMLVLGRKRKENGENEGKIKIKLNVNVNAISLMASYFPLQTFETFPHHIQTFFLQFRAASSLHLFMFELL